ncbi:GDYXXLXY domain-containing protein [Paenalcaligenes hominis]|uniref:GDYXXLXY domain-containing protein n=1 Tax=Paenalcaligenes hominis TaxID=643674 RepID=UPI0035259935
MQVKGLNPSILGLPSWSQFLQRSAMIVATLLLGSALIMAVAANWLSWPKAGRVALLEITVAVFVLSAGWLAWRRPEPYRSAYSLSSLIHVLAAISVGGLLALIGQSYQTGADPWQLFALWALLLVPWAFGLGSLFIILLVMLLTNLALFLYMDETYGLNWYRWYAVHWVGFFFVLLNLFWLGVSRIFSPRMDDPHQLIFRLSLLLVVGSTVVWCMTQNSYRWEFLTVATLLWGVSSYLSRQRRALWSLALFYSAFFVSFLGWLIETFTQSDWVLELLFLPMLILAGVLIRDLRQQWQHSLAQNTESASQDESLVSLLKRGREPWFLRGFVLLAQAIVVVLFAWLLLGAWSIDPTLLAYGFIPVAFVVMGVLLRRPQAAVWLRDLPLFLYLSCCVFMGLVLVENPSSTVFWVVAFSLLSAMLYGVSQDNYLVRLSCAVAIWGFALYGLMWYLDLVWWGQDAIIFWLLVSAWVLCSVALLLQPAWLPAVQSLWWATLFWLILSIFSIEAVAPGFNQAVAWWVPVCVGLSLYRTQPTLFCVMVMAASAVLSVYWLPQAPMANLALSLWVISYVWKQNRLFWFALVLFAAALGLHYYQLSLPLTVKAWDLARGGALLAIGAGVLVFNVRSEQAGQAETPAAPTLTPSRWSTWFLYGGWLLIMAVTVTDVVRKEQLLAKGETVILALAPVDPRSLMQGDYMALRFALSDQVSEVLMLENEDVTATRVVAYVQPYPQAAAQLVGLENPLNGDVWTWDAAQSTWVRSTSTEHLPEQAVPLRLQYQYGNWLPNGVDAWFFPEGKAEIYEDARFGVFKVNKQADALLYELLDEQAQPF